MLFCLVQRKIIDRQTRTSSLLSLPGVSVCNNNNKNRLRQIKRGSLARHNSLSLPSRRALYALVFYPGLFRAVIFSIGADVFFSCSSVDLTPVYARALLSADDKRGRWGDIGRNECNIGGSFLRILHFLNYCTTFVWGWYIF